MSMWQKETRKPAAGRQACQNTIFFFVNMINLFTFASELNNFSL